MYHYSELLMINDIISFIVYMLEINFNTLLKVTLKESHQSTWLVVTSLQSQQLILSKDNREFRDSPSDIERLCHVPCTTPNKHTKSFFK